MSEHGATFMKVIARWGRPPTSSEDKKVEGGEQSDRGQGVLQIYEH
jgi:hypothetical protein